MSRLLHAGTGRSFYEVQGETTLVRRWTPTLVTFRGDGSIVKSMTTISRPVVLQREDDARIEGLSAFLSSAQHERLDMALTSFSMTIHKFQLSFHAYDWAEQLVDLTTALEGALSGVQTTDVTLRIKSRAAALLATDRDGAETIFHDVDALYDLRSTLVHGGELTRKQLNKLIHKVSTVKDDAPPGIASGYVVDRLRDLVRRALLARIVLAATDHWPLSGHADRVVDAKLSDEATRLLWRSVWREALAGIGAEDAAEQAITASDPLS